MTREQPKREMPTGALGSKRAGWHCSGQPWLIVWIDSHSSRYVYHRFPVYLSNAFSWRVLLILLNLCRWYTGTRISA